MSRNLNSEFQDEIFSPSLKSFLISRRDVVELFMGQWAGRGPLFKINQNIVDEETRTENADDNISSTFNFNFSPVPCTMLPTPIDRNTFLNGTKLALECHKLFYSVSTDIPWVLEVLKPVIKGDQWIRKLAELVEAVYIKGVNNKNYETCLRAYMTRADFMLDESNYKLVEMNPIAVSGSPFTARLAEVQKSFLSQLKAYGYFDGDVRNIQSCPDIHNFFNTLNSCCDLYYKRYSRSRVGVLVVTDGEREVNYSDVHSSNSSFLELQANKEDPCPIFIMSNDDFGNDESLYKLSVKKSGDHPEESVLCLEYPSPGDQKKEIEIAVVYFRTQYRPEHFTERHYQKRQLVEMSTAFSIPSVPDILTGMKKVQQVWTQDGVLERFFFGNRSDEESIEKENGQVSNFKQRIELIRSSFVPFVDPCLDASESATNEVKRCMEFPDEYVLKPCREGGNNNVFGQDIISVLTGIMNGTESNHFLLMRKIKAVRNSNVMIRRTQKAQKGNMEVKIHETVSEVGYFNCTILNHGVVVPLSDEQSGPGYLLRTKPTSINEGGLVVGAAGADCYYLI